MKITIDTDFLSDERLNKYYELIKEDTEEAQKKVDKIAEERKKDAKAFVDNGNRYLNHLENLCNLEATKLMVGIELDKREDKCWQEYLKIATGDVDINDDDDDDYDTSDSDELPAF